MITSISSLFHCGFKHGYKSFQKKKDFSDDEEDFNLDEDAVYPSAARTTTGRARSSVKYTFDSDEELSDF